jgi:hypothetical protein
MNILSTILLTSYKSGGEAIVVGLLQGLLIWGGITIYRSIKKTAQGKKFDEVKEEEKKKDQNL